MKDMGIWGDFMKPFNPFYAPKSLNKTISVESLKKSTKDILTSIEYAIKALWSS